ncbi:uncharacterized protein [Cherax quadricarinatus]
MRYSGLMQSERRPASLRSVAIKRLRKQIVFEASPLQIGETIHSGPTLVVQEKLKNEDVATRSTRVFPADARENVRVLRRSCHLVKIPSTRQYSRKLRTPLCPASQPQPVLHRLRTQCDVGATVHHKTSPPEVLVPETLVPELIVPKTSDLKATIHQVTVPTVVTEAPVPEESVAEAISEACVEAAVPEVLTNVATVPELSLNETTVPEVTPNETALPQNRLTDAYVSQKFTVTSATEILFNEATAHKVIKKEPLFSHDSENECDNFQDLLNKTDATVEVKVNQLSILENKVTKAANPKVQAHDSTLLLGTVNEGAFSGLIKTEAALPELETKPVITGEIVGEVASIEPTIAKSKASVLDFTSDQISAHSQASPPAATKLNREMVRLIQEADAKLNSFCQKRRSRASKRLNSADFEAVVIKSEPLVRAKRFTKPRKCSCRSEKSESETSDSRSVADKRVCFDMVDKTIKRGKPKNGEPLLGEAATHVSAKYNGDVTSELVNGAHKVKGRRISRVNSDESDNSSVSRSNGNIEHNGEKLDFSLLLEISPADRKTFESKKAKIRKKTADWLLISETEQYYNEKEEIMRNKNKVDSDSESDESDDGTENQDSKSDCSDESEGTANPPRGRGKGKGKHSRTTDDDCKSSAKRIKDDPGLSKRRGRPVGSRNRKTRYDLTMLNDDDDDDDDENFFGFPVSTTIPQSNSVGIGSTLQTRCKIKGGSKRLSEASSSRKSGRKRLSDAERFLRDNREYYHFQETAERLRRSTSVADKERTKADEFEGKEFEKEDSKLKETSNTKKCFTFERRRRVTRSTGGKLEDPRDGEKSLEKMEIKEKPKSFSKNSDKFELKDKDRDIRRASDDKKRSSEEQKRKGLEEEKRRVSEDKRKVSEEKRKVLEEDKRKVSEDRRKVSEEKRRAFEEEKRKVSVEKRRVSEEEKKRTSEEKRKVSEEEKRKSSEEEKRSSEEKRRASEEEKRRASEEEKRRASEEEKRRASEEEKRRASEEEKRRASGEEKRRASEEEKRRASEEKRRAFEEEKRRASEEEKRRASEDEKRRASEEEKRRASEEEKRRAFEEEKRRASEEEKRRALEEERRRLSEEEKSRVPEGENGKVFEEGNRKISEEKSVFDEENRRSCDESALRSTEGLKTKYCEEDLRITYAECKKKANDVDKRKNTEDGKKKGPEVDKRKTCDDEERIILAAEEQTELLAENLCQPYTNIDGYCSISAETSTEMIDGSRSDLQDLYFSFEGVPEQECWYQTYQRLIDGNDVNEFVYEEEPLKFVLPYEMPKEYVRDFLCYKKGLVSKKKNDLADLVRKSPRCHASTLALFSDIIPAKKAKSSKVAKSAPLRVDEASSDGTSTPGAESVRMQPPESFESTEELAILALHIDHVMKLETSEENPVCSAHLELKESEEQDLKKTLPKKRGKKKRLTSSKFDKGSVNVAKELKLYDSPLAHEVDPFFIAGLCDEVKDYLMPENILAREASEVIDDACFCVCTDRASCDEFSSADDNTEASSECVSLCDSETIDGSVVSEPKPCRSGKKRRKNLTGWPKTQKKKKSVPSHTSDDNDSAIGCEDLEPKKQGRWKKHDDFSFLEQTTTEKLAALAACDRRASPRKKASVLYMDTWPVRFRTQK